MIDCHRHFHNHPIFGEMSLGLLYTYVLFILLYMRK